MRRLEPVSRRAPACWPGGRTGLAELVSGQAVTRVHELVDPARCIIWATHNRDYDALNQTNCADLIESLRAQGR